MRDWIIIIGSITLAVFLISWGIWWQFFADCSFVKEFWYLGYFPGRCV